MAADIEFSKKLIQESKEFEDKMMQQRGNSEDRPLRPVNKNKPDDWKKAQECQDLVKKIKREKKERERMMQEKHRKQDIRIQSEILERQRLAEQKDQEERMAKEKRRVDLELKWNERVQKRQQSIGEMIERTRQIKGVK